MEKKNKYLNIYFACVTVLLVEHSLFHFLVVNTVELKYYKYLFIPSDLHTDDVDKLLISLRNLSLVSKLEDDLAVVLTLTLLDDGINMMVLAVLNCCPAHTMCQAKETQRLATLNIFDVLKKTEQELVTMVHRQVLKDICQLCPGCSAHSSVTLQLWLC